MEFKHFNLETCSQAQGVVVVIDVIRAFSTAAYALAAGAERILLVGEVEEAHALRQQIPDALLMGEMNGVSIPGFDLGNSPQPFLAGDFSGRTLIQRTSNGTQGVVRSRHAKDLLTASFCTAQATADYIKKLQPDMVSFVITGANEDYWGDEDAACADYIEALLCQNDVDATIFLKRVLDSPTGILFANPARPEYPASDLPYCTNANCFNFAMRVEKKGPLLMLCRKGRI